MKPTFPIQVLLLLETVLGVNLYRKKEKKKKKRKKEPELHRNTSKTKIMSTYFGIQLTMKSWNASVYSSSTWEQTGVEYGTKYSRMDQVKFVENSL